MAITGNPGDLATGGFGTGISGRAATPRDVERAVARGEAMGASRTSGGGGSGNVRGNEFSGTGVGGSALGLLSAQPVSPMAPYGNAFDFTGAELTQALMSLNKANMPGAGMWDLLGLQSALKKPENIAMSEALGGPFISYQDEPAPTPSLPSGVLGGAFNQPPLTASTQPVASQQQDMGPLSDAAISAALSYQNTPLENDIAYLASRVGPSASPEALALVEPAFVTELARELRKAEETTGTTARINDLYRSPDTQGELYTRLKAQDPNYMVAPAGSSWHQGAIAADIARSPVLNYMRANTPSTLNFPYGQNDLVHVQLSDPEIAALGYQMKANKFDKSPLRAFTSTMGDGGFMLAGGDFGQMSPVSVAAAPSPSPVPVRAVMPQQPTNVAFNQPLAPRTPTPTVIDRIATSVLGIPGYDTGPGLLSGAAKAGEYGSQMLAASQPQGVEPAAVTAPPVNRPTAAPTSLASLLFERGMERRGEGRRRKRKSTTTEQMQSDTIGGLLA